MSDAFDPYSSWLGIPPERHPPDHYALLGLRPFEPDPRVIREAAERRALLVRSHQSGEHVETCERILHDLAAAAERLLNTEKRSEYDERLREARRMDDTRTMSDPDLKVGAAVTTDTSKRWEAGGRERVDVEFQPATRGGPSPPSAAEAESDDILLVVGSSSGALDSSTDVVEAPPDDRRHPLLTVILISTGLGVLLVAMLAVVAALTGTRSLPPGPDDPISIRPISIADPTISGDLEEPGEPSGVPPAAVSPVAPSDDPSDGARDTPAPADTAPAADEPGGATVDPGTSSSDPDRLPPPSGPEREPLLARVEAAYDFAQFVNRRQMLDLAEQLFDQAGACREPAALAYVLLLKSSELAAMAGDSALAYAACQQIGSRYDVDQGEASRLLDETLGPQADAGQQRWQRLARARETLVFDPLHPSANTELGTYYCFVRDDWRRGLPFLTRGDDTALRLLAKGELSDPGTWQARLELGDTWWAVSLLADPERKAAEQERAAHWYRLALPDLEGDNKRRAQSRLASLIAIPGLDGPGGPVEPANRDEDASPTTQQPIDLTGMWKSDRRKSVFRLRDDGTTVRCELVSSETVKTADGLWLRDRGQLLCDHWKFSFAADPVSRTWELGCEPTIVDGKTLRLRAEVVNWDRYGRETERRWDTTHWRKLE